jgi:hypothetical protein
MCAAALHTLHKYITADEYRRPHESATTSAHLSPPIQALLQILDSIQPATRWAHADTPNTFTFMPMKVDYNPLRLQAQSYPMVLTHLDTPTIDETYSIRPSRLRTHARGDAAWTRWWRTAILIQCPTALPMPIMNDQAPHTPTGYLQIALTKASTSPSHSSQTSPKTTTTSNQPALLSNQLPTDPTS